MLAAWHAAVILGAVALPLVMPRIGLARLGRASMEWVPARYRQWGLRRYRASAVLALGAVLVRWRR